MYSLGIPPEILGIDILTKEDFDFIKEFAPHLIDDLADACTFANEENIERLLGVKTVSSMNMFKKELNREHKALTTFLYDWVKERFDPSHTREILEWAAQTRGFLG